MSIPPATLDLLRHLATRPGHDEVKAGFRQLMVEAFDAEIGAVSFEFRLPEVRGRLDALIGRTVFEAKSHLDQEWRDVERRMPQYLADREREEGARYVGIASDGLKWVVCEQQDGTLLKVRETTLNPDHAEMFLAWLDGALALKSSLPPDPLTIRAELGQESVAYHRAHQELTALWRRLADQPAEALKRQLWAQLLKQVYGREIESDALWFQHTFLVVVAKCIALAVMRLPEDDPQRLLSGQAFTTAGIHGAVESDFFDWVVAHEDGRTLVRRIMNHVRRFRLAEVECDVLKVLYESLIDREERHGLGEYYTPDWLAAKVMRHAVTAPLEQRVLDPGCGSGTFLFHAVRNFLTEAREAGMEPGRQVPEATAHVAGTDIHPVAVIIARVTYLLALAPALDARQGSFSIPVYLGDAMQLSISELMGGKELTIRVPPPPAGHGRSGEVGPDGREQLDFPDTFCRDPALFDKAIERMRTGSEADMTRDQIEKALFRITEQHYRADVTPEQQHAIRDLGKTYVTFDRLRREGRDTVWAYVARNLSRPLAFSAAGGWAHVLVGNPPWVAYRHMSADLQRRFKELAKGEQVYVGGKLATQNDLCALFAVRAAHLYLRSGGRIALVMPMAVLTRGQFEGLRSGSFQSVRIAWDEAWTMSDAVTPLFPVPACAIFGRRRAVQSAMPDTVRAYSGRLSLRDAPEAMADRQLTVIENARAQTVATFEGGSVYRKAFKQGAILVPRMLCMAERKISGRLGANPAAPAITSRRSSQEKEPWKSLPALEGNVEAEFLRPVLLGESILPWRVWNPFEGVIPVNGDGVVLDAEGAANRGYGALHDWLRKVEKVWEQHRPSEMSFSGQIDYYGKLSAQFPISKIRVVYAASGSLPAACIVTDKSSIIEHALYWTPVESVDAGMYISSIINSESLRSKAEDLQSRGQFGARHFDKVLFSFPIPRFDPAIALHRDLAEAGARAEKLAAAVSLPEGVKFQRARALVRTALEEAGINREIDALVTRLLDQAVG